MRPLLGFMVATIAAGPLQSAPALKEPPARTPDVVGEWEVESLTLDGAPLDLKGVHIRFRFTADGRWAMWYPPQSPPLDEWPRYTTNPLSAPAAVTLTNRAGSNN